MEALELTPASTVDVDDTLRAELIEGPNLHEHWKEQMPVFDVNPRPKEPVKSGKSFAARNPEATPFNWLTWSNSTGALLLPNVSARALHQLLDDVEAESVSNRPSLADFVPPRAPTPWRY